MNPRLKDLFSSMCMAIRQAAKQEQVEGGDMAFLLYPQHHGADVLLDCPGAGELCVSYPMIENDQRRPYFARGILDTPRLRKTFFLKTEPNGHTFLIISVSVCGRCSGDIAIKLAHATELPIKQWCAKGIDLGGKCTSLFLFDPSS